MNEQQLAQVYEMVDNIPFSRQKKNIARDFSDALMMAELIHHYYPKRVQLHNYPSSNTASKKTENWNTLNNKVLKKMGIGLNSKEIQQIVSTKPLAIQKLLYRFLLKFERPEEQLRIPHRFEPNQSSFQPAQTQNSAPNPKPQGIGLSLPNRKGQVVNVKPQNEDNQEILDLIDKIDNAYAQLSKLQEMSRLKDDVIKNLEKKVQKIIFS